MLITLSCVSIHVCTLFLFDDAKVQIKILPSKRFLNLVFVVNKSYFILWCSITNL